MLEPIAIHTELSNEEYHSSIASISASGIKAILQSPAKYHHEYLSGIRREQTRSMLIGSAVHMSVLEPKKFPEHFIELPESIKRRAGKEYDLFFNANIDKHILNRTEWDLMLELHNAIMSNTNFATMLKAPHFVEHSLFCDYDGVTLRARPDFYNDDFIVDLKTTASAHPDDFAKSCSNYGYHIQAALQLDLLECLTGKERQHVILCVEESPPHLTAMYMLDEDSIELGRSEYQRGAIIYQQCLAKKNWPGYSDKIEVLRLPHWSIKKLDEY